MRRVADGPRETVSTFSVSISNPMHNISPRSTTPADVAPASCSSTVPGSLTWVRCCGIDGGGARGRILKWELWRHGVHFSGAQFRDIRSPPRAFQRPAFRQVATIGARDRAWARLVAAVELLEVEPDRAAAEERVRAAKQALLDLGVDPSALTEGPLF